MSSLFLPCVQGVCGKRFVLTGGPGVGKTTLIRELHGLGYQIVPEIYAVLYEQAVSENRLATFFADPVALYASILKEQIQWEQALDGQAIAFLDRSTIDIIAFARHFNVRLSDEFTTRARRSYDLIFFLDPLPKDLYKRCAERKESHQEAKNLHHLIKETYIENGYAPHQLIEVPFGSIQERIDFICKIIVDGVGMSASTQKESNLVY